MEENYLSFESYFHGQMSAKESLDFQTALSANQKLKEEYEIYLSIKKATSDIEKEKIRQQLESIEITEDKEELIDHSSKGSAKIFSLLKWASSVAAIFIVGFFGYQLIATPSPEALYAQNFEAYEMQSSRGEEDLSFPDIGRIELKTPELKLFYSTRMMANDDIDEALKTLNEISDDSSLRDQKYWYLALANLKTGNTEEAIKHLDHLRSISNYKKPEIEEILSAIRK